METVAAASGGGVVALKVGIDGMRGGCGEGCEGGACRGMPPVMPGTGFELMMGDGRCPWNCHGVSCHWEEREFSACVSVLNLLRCRRFWNHTWTHRGVIPNCVDSWSLCSTSGCGSRSKAATRTLICFCVRLMRLAILGSVWERRSGEPFEFGRPAVCEASRRADWRP